MSLGKYTFGDGEVARLNKLFFDFALENVPITSHKLFTYDPEQFNLVPKRSYTERRIKEKEQELLSLGEKRKNINRQLNEEEKALKLEIDQLKQKLNK